MFRCWLANFGSIEQAPDAISNQTSVAGVVMAQWWLVHDRAQWQATKDDVKELTGGTYGCTSRHVKVD
jgi:hypothetical protein